MSEPTRRLRLDLAYDGTEFAGWQFQPGQRTVQGVLEQALSRLRGAVPTNVRGAGRTDAGVHARNQVADCDLPERLGDEFVARALRRMLPGDLRPLRVGTAPPSFHARKNAIAKTYRYVVDLSRHGDPFRARFALHYPHPLDPERIRTALRDLPGRRDWSGLAASSCTKLSRVRELTEARMEQPSADRMCLVFTANGFLQHMVRNIVGTLLEIGGRRLPPETIVRALESGDRDLAGPTAAARGLWLEKVRYPDDCEEAARPKE